MDIKAFILDLFFPKFCLNCRKEGSYLCLDCFSLVDIADRQYCPFCKNPKVVFDGRTCLHCRRAKKLDGLFAAASYDGLIIKRLIKQFKYEPYARDLAKTLSDLILTHLSALEKSASFSEFCLVPVPTHYKKLRLRGFNPPEEIAKELAKNLKIPVLTDILLKTKATLPQAELDKEKRMQNIRGVFACARPEKIKNKKILLVDDVFTTGSTMEECAKILKHSGASEVWGIAVARG